MERKSKEGRGEDFFEKEQGDRREKNLTQEGTKEENLD